MQDRDPPRAPCSTSRAGGAEGVPRKRIAQQRRYAAAEETTVKKVVLAYSGGLDTSVAVAWLREQYGVEVVTLTVDVGGGSLREGVAQRAMSAGASRAYVVDARDRFVRQFVWPSLQANARYQGVYPLATALARPLIAQLLVEVANRERADAVAHGCTGKGNDQVRFDVAVHALDRKLEVVAPMRVGMGLSRDQEIEYAQARNIEIPVTKSSPYSIDVNLWGRSIETGILEDPWATPPNDVYEWTVNPGDAPEVPAEVVIGFDGGVPVSIDGELLPAVELVDRLNGLGGKHGVGRIDHVEDRLVGIKSREIYEAPAAVILHAAHAALEGLTLSKQSLRFNRMVSDQVAQDVYDGLWFSALERDLRSYVAASQTVVNGQVRMRLDHGSAVIVGRRSDDSLYDRALATYDEEDAFDHEAAVGFIRIFGLPLKTEAARHGSAWSWTEPLLNGLSVEVADAPQEVKAG
jgi:argininosuccinate synthase